MAAYQAIKLAAYIVSLLTPKSNQIARIYFEFAEISLQISLGLDYQKYKESDSSLCTLIGIKDILTDLDTVSNAIDQQAKITY